MCAIRCPRCGTRVLWTVTEAGRRMPVDPEPGPGGTTAVYRDGTGTWRSRRPTAERPCMGWERLHTPHVATCAGPRPLVGVPRQWRLPDGVTGLAAYRRNRGRGRP